MRKLEITTQVPCLNFCNYCPQDNLIKNYTGNKFLTLDRFKHYLCSISRTINIHFSGFSEPFLNRKCIDMIEFAYDGGHKIVVYTTTMGMTKSIINKLSAIDVELYIHIPNVSTHFNIDIWSRNVLEISKKMDFKFVIVLPYNDKIKQVIEKTNKSIIQQPLINRAGNLDILQMAPLTGKVKCRGKRYNQNVLLPNGDVVLCCMDYSLQYKLGNLNEISYDELFKSDVYREVIKGERDDLICRKCSRGVKA
jgi:sulfatase maturation enzyme AslB (radical SAM superfamily)